MGIERRLPFGQSHADKCRAAELKWRGAPPGMSPELAAEFMAKLKSGSTVRRLTGGGKSGQGLVPLGRFKKHCNSATQHDLSGQTLRTNIEGWKALKLLALDRGASLNDLAIEALNDLLKKHGKRATVLNPHR